MGWKTERRKLQKKLKHKPYRKCPKCGQRMRLRLFEWADEIHRLFKYCGHLCEQVEQIPPVVCHAAGLNEKGCGHYEELFRAGGGTGRHIPH